MEGNYYNQPSPGYYNQQPGSYQQPMNYEQPMGYGQPMGYEPPRPEKPKEKEHGFLCGLLAGVCCCYCLEWLCK